MRCLTQKPHSGFNYSPAVRHVGLQLCPLKCYDEYLYAYCFVCSLDDFLTVIPEVPSLGGRGEFLRLLGYLLPDFFQKTRMGRYSDLNLRHGTTGLCLQGGIVPGKSSDCHSGQVTQLHQLLLVLVWQVNPPGIQEWVFFISRLTGAHISASKVHTSLTSPYVIFLSRKGINKFSGKLLVSTASNVFWQLS